MCDYKKMFAKTNVLQQENKSIREICITLIIDAKALEQQINAVLNSNINEDCKTGLHNLLGKIYDETVKK